MTKSLILFIRESFAIEGVEFLQLSNDVKQNVIRAHERFLHQDPLTIDALVDFVKYVEPTAELRTKPGQDVSVAGHRAMRGGEQVKTALVALLERANMDKRPKRAVSFDYYWQYLWLHPFTDCNGRSARALWLKLLGNAVPDELFLGEFHYQALMYQDAIRVPLGHVEYMLPPSERQKVSEEPNDGDGPLG